LPTFPGSNYEQLKTDIRTSTDYEIKNSGDNLQPSNELKLKMYAFYKQAVGGDVSGKKPGRMDLVGRAKYTAWENIKGLSSGEAMQAYIDSVKELQN